jgi:predicted ATPase/DNA-binding XRE family transcriptional regulator
MQIAGDEPECFHEDEPTGGAKIRASVESAGSTPGPSAFGSLLRRYRLAAGLSQEALAERARISLQAVGALERGHRRAPQRETLGLLVEALALDPGQRSGFEAVARQSGARAIGRGVTKGPWPLSTLPVLPLSLTSFVGHESALREVAGLLRERRLVTLTGPGGIGKTRIALEVGSGVLASGDAVRLVELAAIAEPAHVVSSIAAALHVQGVPSQDVLETVAAYLQRERVLLVLDNCEHVIDEAARVAERLLRSCSALRIFATSREPLRVPGEIVYRVPALDASDAVALFEERARAADFRFALTDANAKCVARICAQLDGIPLAIELAAARVATTPVATIAEHLGRRFAILSRGERTAHPRHRTMWDTIAWSYGLLTEPERRLFERMSIFAGGCTLDAARSGCAGDGVAEFEIEELLESLAAKSLVTVNISGPETRFGMLESFRDFAREKLALRGSLAGVARAHALTFIAHADRTYELLQTDPEDDVRGAGYADLENWRAAIAWAFGPSGDAELGQRLFISGQWWMVETEVQRWLDVALARIDAQTSDDIAIRLAYAKAQLDWRVSGNHVAALENLTRSVAYFDAVGDRFAAARAALRIGDALLRLGRTTDAETALAASLERARSAGASRTVAYSLILTARLRAMHGEFETARAMCDEATALFDRLRSLIGRSLSLQVLAEIARGRGDREAALQYTREELTSTRERNEPNDLCVTLNNLAASLIALDRFDEASTYAREGLDLAIRYALDFRLVWALHHLAAIGALRPRDGGDAGDVRPLVRAAHVIGYVDARLAESETPRDLADRQEYERVLAALDSLDAVQREAALAAGAAMTQTEAIEEVRLSDDVPALPRV